METQKHQPLHACLMTCSTPEINKMAQIHSWTRKSLVEASFFVKEFSLKGCPISPLQAAVMAGNYRICKQLMIEGADTTSPSSVPPPLCIALETDRYQIARLLIEYGADVLLRHNSLYPMFFALKPSTPEFIVEVIVKAGFHPDSMVEEKHSYTALHMAVLNKNLEIVKTLIKLKADCNLKDACFGCTPLHIAISQNVPVIAQILIENGGDLEVENNEGLTPLFVAISENKLPLVNFLLKLGANLQHLSSRLLTYPLNYAAIMGNKEITEALLKLGADPLKVAPGTSSSPLHSVAISPLGRSPSCAERLKDIVKLLIETGIEVDVTNMNGNTPVQLALYQQNFDLVKVLVEEGASVSQEFNSGTNFHFLAQEGPKELVSMFLDYGADYCALDSNGNTPYHVAISNPDRNVLNTFWRFGCPLDMPRSGSACSLLYPKPIMIKFSDQNNFMLGIKENDVNKMKNAISNGAEVNGCSMDIPYPLHFAVSNGFSSVVLLLLENGVPSNIIDNKGVSPLHIAASNGNFQICRYLLRYGACYNYPSEQAGKTPLDMALEHNHLDVANFLRDLDQMFEPRIDKNFEGFQEIFEKSNNVQSLQAYINSINIAGETLMAVALREKNVKLTENLMKLRLSIIKA